MTAFFVCDALPLSPVLLWSAFRLSCPVRRNTCAAGPPMVKVRRRAGNMFRGRTR